MHDDSSKYVGREEMLLHEKQHVLSLRSAELQRLTDPDDIFGLALSGGGIRSATFSLGVIQALSEKKYYTGLIISLAFQEEITSRPGFQHAF